MCSRVRHVGRNFYSTINKSKYIVVQEYRVSANLQYMLCSAIMCCKVDTAAVLNFRRCEQDAVTGHDLQLMPMHDRRLVHKAKAGIAPPPTNNALPAVPDNCVCDMLFWPG